jgi:hypothetical protein
MGLTQTIGELMHGYDFIEWLGESPDFHAVLSEGYDDLFIDVPYCINNHDAMGLVLMGGEL